VAQHYTKVAELQELPPGQMLRVSLADEPVLLVNVDHNIYAIGDRCTHEDASLFKGHLANGCVRCPLHGSRFDVKTGYPLDDPAEEPVPVYSVDIRGDDILISTLRE